MLNIKLYGDKQGERFVWSIMVMDSRRTIAEAEGSSDTEDGAKVGMLTTLHQLVAKLEFRSIDEDAAS